LVLRSAVLPFVGIGMPMQLPHSAGLMAELIAAALLIAALIGFTVQGSKPCLRGIGMAIVILIIAVTIVIDSST
jgi:hypothetical protein